MSLVLALAASVVYGVGDWFGGRASRIQASAVVALAGQVVSMAMIGVVVLVSGTPVPSGPTVALALAGGVCGGLGVVGLYHALAAGDITVVAPITAVAGATLPVVVGIVSGERPGALGYVGIGLALVAVALVSGAFGTHRHSTRPSIVLLALVVGAAFGVLFVVLDHTDPDSGAWPLFIVRWTSIPCIAAVVLLGRQRRVRDRPSMLMGITAGVFDQLANLLYLVAVRAGLLSLVVVVTSLYPASTVLLAFTIDRERVGRWQTLGLGLAAGALVFVSLGR